MPADLLVDVPVPVRAQFELAAARMAESWIATGSVSVSASDFRIARAFLEAEGWTVEERPGVLVRLGYRDGHFEDMSREAAALLALRRLVVVGGERSRGQGAAVESRWERPARAA